MKLSGKILGSLLAAVLLPIIGSASAKAETVNTLHMDINCVSISAVTDLGANAFSTNFTGTLSFSSNSLTNMSVDINSPPFTDVDITGFSGSIHFVNGELGAGTNPDCGAITISVKNPDSSIDSYSYDIESNTGNIAAVKVAPSHPLMGYRLSGATEDGEFANDGTFGGVDVSAWLAQQPLLGNFFEFNYHPNANGVDQNAQVEVDVYAAVPLPASLMSGLVGLGMLGVYRWRRRGRLNSH